MTPRDSGADWRGCDSMAGVLGVVLAMSVEVEVDDEQVATARPLSSGLGVTRYANGTRPGPQASLMGSV